MSKPFDGSTVLSAREFSAEPHLMISGREKLPEVLGEVGDDFSIGHCALSRDVGDGMDDQVSVPWEVYLVTVIEQAFEVRIKNGWSW